jgi:hypothetical protein
MEPMREEELTEDLDDAAEARRTPKLFRVLVLGGLALAVAFASVPHGATGVADSDGGSSDGGGGGGAPGW